MSRFKVAFVCWSAWFRFDGQTTSVCQNFTVEMALTTSTSHSWDLLKLNISESGFLIDKNTSLSLIVLFWEENHCCKRFSTIEKKLLDPRSWSWILKKMCTDRKLLGFLGWKNTRGGEVSFSCLTCLGHLS